MHRNPSQAEIKTLLEQAATIAVVGASPNPGRASHDIMRKLISVGYRVIPVNPNYDEVLGQPSLPSLAAVREPIDIVNVFRRAVHTPEVARQAVAAAAGTLWLQTGIVSDEAARIARAGGLNVVMDACIGVLVSVLHVRPRATPRSRTRP